MGMRWGEGAGRWNQYEGGADPDLKTAGGSKEESAAGMAVQMWKVEAVQM